MAAPVAHATLRHRRGFAIAFAILGLILIAAVVAAVLLSQRDRPAAWSDFRATQSDPVERAVAIAAHVQGRYRADDGAPLTRVTAGEDVITELPQHDQIVAIGADSTGQPFSFEQQSLLIYKLCGPGAACAFATQVDHSLTLAGQQAHELALRGLKDVHEASAVIVQMPPGLLAASGGKAPAAVLYFRRKDLSHQLEAPLARTVAAEVPRPAGLTPAQDAKIVDAVVKSLYTMSVKATPDSTSITYELVPAPTG